MFLIDARGGMESEEFCGGVGILEQEQSFWMSSFRRGGNFIIGKKAELIIGC